ncbi:MAG: carbohydrate kinase, partial [Desulfobacteraceae bacterium 4484_190.3]
MSEKDLLLAIDNGTQSLKALVFDLEGGLVAEQQVMFTPYFSREPGWAEQDPEVFWQSLCEACQGLWHDHKVERKRIAGVSLTTQRATVINVDSAGKPLRPAMLWLDQRKTYGLPPLGGLWGLVFRVLGLTKTIEYFQVEAEANWIRVNEPEVWEKTYKYLLLSGYLTYRLTGAFVDSSGCCVGYLPFDYKHLCWAPEWDWKWRALPMDRDLLPDLVSPARKLGTITTVAEDETGIPAGLPLIAAAADKACEVLGSGSLAPSIGCLSYGTTATINVTHKKYL